MPIYFIYPVILMGSNEGSKKDAGREEERGRKTEIESVIQCKLIFMMEDNYYNCNIEKI